jgi:phosphatidate cytidylyltransferase
MTSALRQRVISGSALSAAIIILLLVDGGLSALTPPHWTVPGSRFDAGPWVFHGAISTAIVLLLTVFSVRELVYFYQTAGYRPFAVEAQLFAAGLVVGPYVSMNLAPSTGWYDESWGIMWLAIALGVSFLHQAVRRGVERAMINPAITIFIIFYAGGLAGYMTKLRMEVGGPPGMAVLLLTVFVVKMTDVGAFFVGRHLGRNKLVEWLSPRKTWEGFVGGLIVAIVSSVAVGSILHFSNLARFQFGLLTWPWGLVVFGLVMGVFSVAGDLSASLLKRDAAVKDSGNAFPGIGGFLDTFDSPLLAAPVAWFFWTRLIELRA